MYYKYTSLGEGTLELVIPSYTGFLESTLQKLMSLFSQIGGPVCRCPYDRIRIIRVHIRAPDFGKLPYRLVHSTILDRTLRRSYPMKELLGLPDILWPFTISYCVPN